MIDKEQLIRERGNECEYCGPFPKTPYEIHHCLIHRKKGVKELDSVYNYAVVCKECHPYCNGILFRQEFWQNQIKRYGKEPLREWLESLPKKLVIEDWIWEAVK